MEPIQIFRLTVGQEEHLLFSGHRPTTGDIMGSWVTVSTGSSYTNWCHLTLPYILQLSGKVWVFSYRKSMKHLAVGDGKQVETDPHNLRMYPAILADCEVQYTNESCTMLQDVQHSQVSEGQPRSISSRVCKILRRG